MHSRRPPQPAREAASGCPRRGAAADECAANVVPPTTPGAWRGVRTYGRIAPIRRLSLPIVPPVRVCGCGSKRTTAARSSTAQHGQLPSRFLNVSTQSSSAVTVPRPPAAASSYTCPATVSQDSQNRPKTRRSSSERTTATQRCQKWETWPTAAPPSRVCHTGA